MDLVTTTGISSKLPLNGLSAGQPINYATAINFLQQSDPVLAQLIERIGPCQLDQAQQTGDLLASLSRAIIFQQFSTKAATSIYHRFLGLYPGTPTAADILNTPIDSLRSAGISRPKIAYLRDLAQKTLTELPSLEVLADLDDEAIIQALTQIKGIGRWSVQMLLIFRLHQWDVLPVDDLGVRAGIRKIYGLEGLPDKKTVEKLGQKWQPYSTIASWYLWRSLEID